MFLTPFIFNLLFIFNLFFQYLITYYSKEKASIDIGYLNKSNRMIFESSYKRNLNFFFYYITIESQKKNWVIYKTQKIIWKALIFLELYTATFTYPKKNILFIFILSILFLLAFIDAFTKSIPLIPCLLFISGLYFSYVWKYTAHLFFVFSIDIKLYVFYFLYGFIKSLNYFVVLIFFFYIFILLFNIFFYNAAKKEHSNILGFGDIIVITFFMLILSNQFILISISVSCLLSIVYYYYYYFYYIININKNNYYRYI